VITELTLGTHFDVALDGDNNVTVTPLSMPAASGTLLIERNTRALQETDFQDLEDFPAATYTLLFDRLTMLAAEAHRDITRKVAPFTTINGVVDFRPYTVRAAEPVNDLDLATKGYVLEITGVLALQGYVDAAAASAVASAASAALAAIAKTGAETARDKAQLWSDQAEDTIVQGSEYSAYHWSRKAVAGAAIVLPYLTETDDGLSPAIPTPDLSTMEPSHELSAPAYPQHRAYHRGRHAAAGEYVYDTTLKTIRVGDGATLGGLLLKLWGKAYTVSPAQITANQNDYSPTDLAIAEALFLDLDADRSITGFAHGGATNRELTLYNTSAFRLTLVNESASSTAGNRFIFGADDVLRPYQSPAADLFGGDLALDRDRPAPAGSASRICRRTCRCPATSRLRRSPRTRTITARPAVARLAACASTPMRRATSPASPAAPMAGC
jgi:hypothetical protein